MIFKILGKTDLIVDISLDKTEYSPGETVRGIIIFRTERGLKAIGLVLTLEGKESTQIPISRGTAGTGVSYTETCRETNVFFSMDFSHLLRESIKYNILHDGTLEIVPQDLEVPFSCIIPNDVSLLASYKGKHAEITYTIELTAAIPKGLDVIKKKLFSVVNTENKPAAEYNNSNITLPSYDNNDDDDNHVNSTIKKNLLSIEKVSIETQNKQGKGKKGISSKFEGIIDYGYHKYILEQNSKARIRFLDSENISITSLFFSPGKIMKGEVILLNRHSQSGRKSVRGMKIILYGIEHAFAKGERKSRIMEKYKRNIELKPDIQWGKTQDITLSFEFQVPEGIKKTYRGKYSEYVWQLEATIDIGWSSDLIAKTIIDII